MVYKIIWLTEAVETYLDIIDYLRKEWTEKEVQKFADRVSEKLKLLELQPRIGKMTGNKPNVHRTLVHKKVTLIYKHKPIKREIELVTFWNNLQNPTRIKY